MHLFSLQFLMHQTIFDTFLVSKIINGNNDWLTNHDYLYYGYYHYLNNLWRCVTIE